MRCVAAFAVFVGCSFGEGPPPVSPAPPQTNLVSAEALDRQNPAMDTSRNKVISRSEQSPVSRDETLAFGIEVAAAVFQELLKK